jgi:hypothetical protein
VKSSRRSSTSSATNAISRRTRRRAAAVRGGRKPLAPGISIATVLPAAAASVAPDQQPSVSRASIKGQSGSTTTIEAHPSQ